MIRARVSLYLVLTLVGLAVYAVENYRRTAPRVMLWAVRRFCRGRHRLSAAADRAGRSVDDILNRIQLERIRVTAPSF